MSMDIHYVYRCWNLQLPRRGKIASSFKLLVVDNCNVVQWWTIDRVSDTTGLRQSSVDITHLTSVNNTVLAVPHHFLAVGLYQITFHIAMGKTDLFTTKRSTYVRSTSAPIMAYIGPPAMQAITRGANSMITLSPVTYSYDRDIANRSLPQVDMMFICKS